MFNFTFAETAKRALLEGQTNFIAKDDNGKSKVLFDSITFAPGKHYVTLKFSHCGKHIFSTEVEYLDGDTVTVAGLQASMGIELIA